MQIYKILFAAVCIIFVAFELKAQKKNDDLGLILADYDWDNKRNCLDISEDEQKQSAVILKHKQTLEYYYDQKGRLRMAELVHKIVRINDNRALHQFNKVYITNGGSRIIKIKARAIDANGNKTELQTDNIKTIQSHDENYQIFAIEGAEKGGEVEYFYILEREGNQYGEEILQTNTLTKNLDFEIISPKNLVFSAKSYNGLTRPVQKSFQSYNLLSLHEDVVPAQKNTQNFTYTAHLFRLNYKQQTDFHKGDYPIIAWNDIADEIALLIYPSIDEKVKIKLIEKINAIVGEAKSDEDKIKIVDNYLKNYIRAKTANLDENANLLEIFENKFATDLEMVKLYAFIFETLNIDHQLVATSNRNLCKFDPDFPSWDYIHAMFFYFPKLKTYLSANDKSFTLGFIPYFNTANMGLFIHKIDLGTRVGGSSYTNFINAPAQSEVISTFDVRFDALMEFAKLDQKQIITGAKALSFDNANESKHFETQQIFHNKFRKSMFSKAAKSGNADFFNEPIKFEQIKVTDELTDIAGNKILVKLDKFLSNNTSNQQNFEHESLAEIELECQEVSQTKVSLAIPEGFMVRNLEDLNKKITFGTKKKMTMGLITSYVLQDNILTLSIDEFYNEINYNTEEEIQNYWAVKTASRNLKDLVLIFEKKVK